jgi:nucleoside-diphosphate-sugar epimerase
VDDPIGLFAWNNFYRDYIHADEIAAGIKSAAEYTPAQLGHTVINIASGQARSNATLIQEMTDLGAGPSYTRIGDADTPDYSWGDISRAAELLDFHPDARINLRT